MNAANPKENTSLSKMINLSKSIVNTKKQINNRYFQRDNSLVEMKSKTEEREDDILVI